MNRECLWGGLCCCVNEIYFIFTLTVNPFVWKMVQSIYHGKNESDLIEPFVSGDCTEKRDSSILFF